jgi:hypothetical protein
VKDGFLAVFRLGLCGLAGLGSGGSLVLVVTVKGPTGACGSGNRTESAESECEASSQKEFLHCEHLNWTISNIWGGERLLYGRTVLHGRNRTERLGGEGKISEKVGFEVWSDDWGNGGRNAIRQNGVPGFGGHG